MRAFQRYAMGAETLHRLRALARCINDKVSHKCLSLADNACTIWLGSDRQPGELDHSWMWK